ncbi:sulfatase family protein [Sinomicrobium weinanense]|uniref:Sulfatase n=1 Tax=Sinomicrobium weinanense TaxID=2842200 RepID=A0A926JQQ2_9FLAO|nr:sulfatase [Sinomicrobium weinanense]MBC9795735.1 sulfatase [Sinomicrobium weinanense]MBU3125298.1 sulfatase [Sinomicrobium weinanense]
MLTYHYRTFTTLLMTIFLITGHQAKAQTDTEHPNIIFLLTDDQRWDALGAMGNPLIKTPHLDGLAENGILFTNAYVTTSICAVSRASFLTGQYAARHKINGFRTSLTRKQLQQTYPMLLKASGYQVGFIGKYGVGNPKDQPGDSYDFWECTNKHQPDYELVTEDGTQIHHTDKIKNDLHHFLSTYTAKEPFCLSVSFKAPHVQDNDPRQFITSPAYREYYRNDTIPKPETATSAFWNKFPDFFRSDTNIARERWKIRFANDTMYENSVKNYYRLITHVDDVVGNLIRDLEDKGIADNTVIIFMGDNGFFLGEHGLAGKWYGYEESIRVPLIIYDPRLKGKDRGVTSSKIALNIDIAPTILGLAGVPAPGNMQGVDLYSQVKGKVPERQEFFYEHHYLGGPKIPESEGVVSREFKYLKYTEHDYEEFFDLRKDPREKNNLIQDKKYRKLIDKYRSKYKELVTSVQ